MNYISYLYFSHGWSITKKLYLTITKYNKFNYSINKNSLAPISRISFLGIFLINSIYLTIFSIPLKNQTTTISFLLPLGLTRHNPFPSDFLFQHIILLIQLLFDKILIFLFFLLLLLDNLPYFQPNITLLILNFLFIYLFPYHHLT